MPTTQELIAAAKAGFRELTVNEEVKEHALAFLTTWLTLPEFNEYRPQIEFLIKACKWSLLLDSFYQIIPFGTGGRRGPVGIGPNRINPWTITASAQGHADYLIHTYGNEAKKRGIVLAYDVRKYPETGIYSPNLPNPVRGMTSKDLAVHASQVYSANGIHVRIFREITTTPELSFTIRQLHAIAGDMFSASHNPKEDNGKKIYVDHGGQMVPPLDQTLSDYVNKVKKIKMLPYKEACSRGLVTEIGHDVHEAYLSAAAGLALTDRRGAKIVYSSLHGVGTTSVYETLKKLGFNVFLDTHTSTPNGNFPNVMFNIPNPEVEQSMNHVIEEAESHGADLAIASDPDADRIGVSIRNAEGKFTYLNGNEIGLVLLHFILSELQRKRKLTRNGLIVTTCVSSELAGNIARSFHACFMNGLMVGFKYIAEVIRELDEQGRTEDFIFGFEESHGYLFGTYSRDKDAASAAVPLCELASVLKDQKRTIIDYLDDIYLEHGYHRNFLHQIAMRGAEGTAKIQKIQAALRNKPCKRIAGYKVREFRDHWGGKPTRSETDRMSRNVLTFYLEPPKGMNLMKVTIRPSGTEPKTKIYFEVGAKPLGKIAGKAGLARQKKTVDALVQKIEAAFIQGLYRLIDIDMPTRGLLISPLVQVEAKLAYFDIEKRIIDMKKQVIAKKLSNKEFQSRALELLKAFGADPIEKVSPAFQAKTRQTLRSFLGL